MYDKQPDVLLEPTDMIDQCCVSISQNTLDSLSDEDYAKALYFKFLDRPPEMTDIKRITTRLASSKSTRKDELNKVMSSTEYVTKGVKYIVV